MDKPNDQSSRWSSESNYPPQVGAECFTLLQNAEKAPTFNINVNVIHAFAQKTTQLLKYRMNVCMQMHVYVEEYK